MGVRARSGRCLVAVVALSLAMSVPAAAAPKDVAEAAAGFLVSQQNPDGSWGPRGGTRVAFTSEAVMALRAYGRRNAAYYKGITWLENRAMTSADAQARRILALLPHGDDISRDRERLAQSFSEIGWFGNGWGLSGTYGASPIDTVLALEAWAALGVPSSVGQDVLEARNFLVASQSHGPDLGWPGAIAAGNPQGDPVTTALALRSLAALGSEVTGIAATGNDAASFLSTNVATDSPLRQQAHAALALVDWNGATAAPALFSSLEASQVSGGSWNGDVHTTAVALHAFAALLGRDQAHLQEKVFPEDLGLRSAINRELGDNRVDALTRSEMRELTSLDASDSGIESLEGIQEAQNLQSINLLGNDIDDLSPLDSLPNLTEVLIATPCDPSQDGMISVADARHVLRVIESDASLSEQEKAALDVVPAGSPDGVVTVGDAGAILRAAAGHQVAACES